MTVTLARLMQASLLALAAGLSAPGTALAHGEAEPGPNGGEVRMPGAFHVEAVAGNDVLLVYLLDTEIQNPKVAGSSVEVKLEQNGKEWQLDCRAVEADQKFRCPLPAAAELDSGELTIEASRGGVPGAVAQYELPMMQGDGTET